MLFATRLPAGRMSSLKCGFNWYECVCFFGGFICVFDLAECMVGLTVAGLAGWLARWLADAELVNGIIFGVVG